MDMLSTGEAAVAFAAEGHNIMLFETPTTTSIGSVSSNATDPIGDELATARRALLNAGPTAEDMADMNPEDRAAVASVLPDP